LRDEIESTPVNFRTTLILIVLLAAVGAVVLFTRDRAAKTEETTEAPRQAKVLGIDSAKVAKLLITPGNDKPIVLERSGADWRISEPVNAPADPAAAATLVDALANLQSLGDVETSAAASSATGLDHPRFKAQLTTTDGKSSTLLVGEPQATGRGLYVQREGDKAAQIVDAGLLEQLDKPAMDFRRKKLFDVATPQVQQLQIQQGDAAAIALQKKGADWEMTAPREMPADESEVSDLAAAVTTLQASKFVAETVDDPRRRRLDAPQLVVSFSTTQPSTQPTSQPTTAGAMTSVKFGGYTDVTKESVYAVASNAPTLITVPASTLERLKKKPLDLRDKRAVTIDPEQVQRISIVHDRAATTRPTTQPAAHDEVSVERVKQVVSTTLPTTAPTTAPTTLASATTAPATAPTTAPATAPSTRPAEPPGKWQVTASPEGTTPANDRRVQALLASFHPLRAVRYLESNPATQPAERYVITIDTLAAGGASSGSYVIRLSDPGNGQPVIGDYNGLTFEISRTLLDAVKADLRKSAKSSQTPEDSDEPTPFPAAPRPPLGPDGSADR
jgi:hypothetical protein